MEMIKMMNASKNLPLVEKKAVTELRNLVAPWDLLEEVKLNSDMFFVRYLRASKFNMEKAEKMIRYYVDYIHSQKEKPEDLLKTIFPGDFSESFKSYIGGHDNEGRPLVMIPEAGKWNLRKAILSGREEMFIAYFYKVALVIETEILKRDADYGICVVDVSNIPYVNYFHRRSCEVLVELVRVLEKLAPEVIKKVYIVNAPKLWIALLHAVQAIITINADVVTFGCHDKVWKTKIRDAIPEDGICPEFGGTCTNYTIV